MQASSMIVLGMSLAESLPCDFGKSSRPSRQQRDFVKLIPFANIHLASFSFYKELILTSTLFIKSFI